MSQSRAFLERLPLAFLGYLALLVASLLPLSIRPWDTIADVGDSLDAIYFLAWNAHQLFTDPLRLFEANLLHPHKSASLFDTHRLLGSILAAPLIKLTGNPVLATNLVTGFALVFAAMSGSVSVSDSRTVCQPIHAVAARRWAWVRRSSGAEGRG